jgi:hypothetical protein
MIRSPKKKFVRRKIITVDKRDQHDAKLTEETAKLLELLNYVQVLGVARICKKKNPANRFKLLEKAFCLLSSVPLISEEDSQVNHLEKYWIHFKT